MRIATLLPWRFLEAGFPVCHVACARNYWVVLWRFGKGEERVALSVS